MRFKKVKAALIAATAASLALLNGPANATGSTSTTDATGYDYDPACVVSTSLTPPAPDSIGASGCTGVSTHDGSAAALDITNAAASGLPTTTNCPAGRTDYIWLDTSSPPPKLKLCLHILGSLPVPGSTNKAALDLPSSNFVGANYFWMFQNKSVETNVPTNPNGGCTRVGVGNQVLDQYGSWKDGFHFFVNYGVNWDGNKWIHSVQIGEYSPDPSGGFGFYEVGTNDGTGWKDANPYMKKGTDWDTSLATDSAGTLIDVTVPGIFKTPDTTNCQEGFFKHAFMKPGDVIGNVKGLTTANEVVTLPVTVPLSKTCELPTSDIDCESDLTTVGGFVFFADVTDGNSTAGLANSNIIGIAYTGGAVGVSDTLGDGPTCPTPTFGGLLPTNPLFAPDTACQIDDDNPNVVGRGNFLSEWWDTTHGFTA
jgi:hypothetical protein